MPADPLSLVRQLYAKELVTGPRPGTSEGESAIAPVSSDQARFATVANSKDNPALMATQLPTQNSLAASEKAQKISDMARDAGMGVPTGAAPPEEKAAPAKEPAAEPAPAMQPTWIDRATDSDFSAALAADTGGRARAAGIVQTADGKTVRAIETDPITLQNLLSNPKYPASNLVFRVQTDVPTWRDLVYGNPDLTIERVPTPSEQLAQRITEAKENEEAALAETESFASALYPQDQVEGLMRRAKTPELALKENDSLTKQLADAQEDALGIQAADEAMRVVLASDLEPGEKMSKIRQIEAVKAKAEAAAKQIPMLQSRLALNKATIDNPNYMQRGHAELQQIEKDSATPAQKHAARFFLDYNENTERPRPPKDYVEKAREAVNYAGQVHEIRSAYDKAKNTQIYDYLGRVKKILANGGDGFAFLINDPNMEQDAPAIMAATNALQLDRTIKNPKLLGAAGALFMALGDDAGLLNALDSFAADVASGADKSVLSRYMDTGEKPAQTVPGPGGEPAPEEKPLGPNLYAQARTALETPQAKAYLTKAGYEAKDIADLLKSPARIRNAIMLLASDASRDIVYRAAMTSFYSPEEIQFYYKNVMPSAEDQISDLLKTRAVADEFGLGNSAWIAKHLNSLAGGK